MDRWVLVNILELGVQTSVKEKIKTYVSPTYKSSSEVDVTITFTNKSEDIGDGR